MPFTPKPLGSHCWNSQSAVPGGRQAPREAAAGLWTLYTLLSTEPEFSGPKSKDPPLFNSINSPVFGFRSSTFRSHKSNGGNAYARKPNWSNLEASSLKCLCPARETTRELVIPGPCRSEQKATFKQGPGPSAQMSNVVSRCGLEVSPESTCFVFQEARKLATASTQRSVSLESLGGWWWLFGGYLIDWL